MGRRGGAGRAAGAVLVYQLQRGETGDCGQQGDTLLCAAGGRGTILGCMSPVLSLIHYLTETSTHGLVVRTRRQDEVPRGVASVLVKCQTAGIVTLHLPRPAQPAEAEVRYPLRPADNPL